MSRMQ